MRASVRVLETRREINRLMFMYIYEQCVQIIIIYKIFLDKFLKSLQIQMKHIINQ